MQNSVRSQSQRSNSRPPLIGVLALATFLVVGAKVVRAEDPKGPAQKPADGKNSGAATDAVTVKLAPKAGDVVMFHQKSSASTEVDGKSVKAAEEEYDYAITIGQLTAAGGYTGKLKVERVRLKVSGRGEPTEIDTAKPMSGSEGMQAQIMGLMAQAFTTDAFDITVSADGRLESVTGFREALAAKVKDTPFENMLPLDQLASPKESVKAFEALFAALPDAGHVPGTEWTTTASEKVSSQSLDFDVTSTLSLPAPDLATVTSKYKWKPGAAATADGAVAEGGGTVTAAYSRKDGLPTRIEKKLFANRDTAKAKATSHTDSLLERVAAPAKAPADPTTPAKPDAKK